MRATHIYPSSPRAGPYAYFSRRKEAVNMAKVPAETPSSCRPGWTPDYELIASRIPTLILPSYAIVGTGLLLPCFIHTDCFHSPVQYHLNGPMPSLAERTIQLIP